MAYGESVAFCLDVDGDDREILRMGGRLAFDATGSMGGDSCLTGEIGWRCGEIGERGDEIRRLPSARISIGFTVCGTRRRLIAMRVRPFP